jgi:two-component system OmpR family response regulator
MRVLIGADMSNLAEAIRREFITTGVVVDMVDSMTEAEDLFALNHYDAIVLDEQPAASVLIQAIRRGGSDSPIVVLLSPSAALEDRIAILNAGADDVVTKPCDPRELVARVHSVVRRSVGITNGELRVADLVLDPVHRTVHRGGTSITLRAKEFRMLEYLMLHRGKVLSKERLAGAVWDGDADEHIHLVEVYISTIRRKLDSGATWRLIHTVKGVGYKISGEE